MSPVPRSSIVLTLLFTAFWCAIAQGSDVGKLTAAMLGDTPVEEDLWYLTDRIGGRATGSEANLRSVEWALQRFREAGVEARKEAFPMPSFWLEENAAARITGDASFSPGIVAMPYSVPTPPGGITAPLVLVGRGSEEDFKRMGSRLKGAFVLVETEELLDLDDLFREYNEAAAIDARAFDAGVAGVVYMGSRPHGLLYRHIASLGHRNRHPMMVMEREEAMRAARLLEAGSKLELTAILQIDGTGSLESYNVIGEIRGSGKPEEFVVIGAHLDSWDLGTGALDNGCNVAMVIDIARQIKRLGITPRRTIRFALWNGEEQGIYGSYGYTVSHADELDRHVMASSYDIGTGSITGFFTGGRPEIAAATDRALEPVKGLGPFTQVDIPVVGTDNFDFMMQGVANLIANQESANYGPNYHARSDTYDKVDLPQLKLNSAIAAAVTWQFATMDVTWKRQTVEEVERLIATTDVLEQMKSFAGIWFDWVHGDRSKRK
jgi:hypothetical protein